MKLKEFIKKRESYVVALLVAIFNYMPISYLITWPLSKVSLCKFVDIPKLDTALWAIFICALFEIFKSKLHIEIYYYKKRGLKDTDLVLEIDQERTSEFYIEVNINNYKEKFSNKEIYFVFPKGVSLTGSHFEEDKFVNDNRIEIPLSEISGNGEFTLNYSIALEDEQISGKNSEIKCKSNLKTSSVVEKNKFKLFWGE